MTWRNYVEKLFDNERQEHKIDNVQGDKEPKISKEETKNTLVTMKNAKSPGTDVLT